MRVTARSGPGSGRAARTLAGSSSTRTSSSAGRSSPNTSEPFDDARRLFPAIALDYERWARVLSLGQDQRWRREMVASLRLAFGDIVLDVAAGTGSISELLTAAGCDVVAFDQSQEMLLRHAGGRRVRGRAERLPFPDGCFDAVTFGYLLRYVSDPAACLRELARVIRPGGGMGMVEFGRPDPPWLPLWRLYTRAVLPVAGQLIGPGWRRVGHFLGHNIEDFHRRHTIPHLVGYWQEAGFRDVRVARPSLGGGLVMWGTRT